MEKYQKYIWRHVLHDFVFFLTWLNFWTHNFFPKFLTFLVARHHFERSYKAQAWFPIRVIGPTNRF